MLYRRPDLGDRPSSISASLSPPASHWTPDFSAGASALEVESLLHGYLIHYRTAMTAAAALGTIARPEALRDRRLAWVALATESAGVASLWYRSRTWRTLREPGVLSGDTLSGLAGSALALRAVHVEDQLDGDLWTNWLLRARLTTVPLADRRGLELLTRVGIQFLPHLVASPPGGRGRLLLAHRFELANAFVLGYVAGRLLRSYAGAADARALRWAEADLARALTREEQVFRDEVLSPCAEVLGFLGDPTTDPTAAVEAAAREERRLRDWIGTPAVPAHDSGRSDDADQVVDHLRIGLRRFEGVLRVLSACSAVSRRVDGAPRPSRTAWALRAALAAHGVSGIALGNDRLVERVGERVVRRWAAATDTAVVAAATAHELGAGSARRASLEELVHEVITGRLSTTLHHGPEFLVALGGTVALRTWSAVRGRDTLTRGLAEAGSQAWAAAGSALLIRRTTQQVLGRAHDLARATLASVDDRIELCDLRTRQRAFVHDGVVQALGAIRAGDLVDGGELREWIDRERVRIEAALGSRSGGHAGDLLEGLPALVADFGRRGLHLEWEATPLPDWVSEVGATVVEITREALNNVVKHGAGDAAWCGIMLLDDGRVRVRIVDFATDGREFVPGSGSGTAAMAGLAAMIGARIDWLRTPSGGTEVRLVLEPPGA